MVISAGLTQTLSRRQDRCYDPHFPDGETLLEPLHDSLRATQGVQVSGLRPQPRAMMTPASLCCPPGLWGFKSCCCLVAQSCPTLCKPIDCSPPGSSVHGVLQARTLEWVAIFSSRGSSRPRDGIRVDCMGRRVLYHTTTWKAQGLTRVAPDSKGMAPLPGHCCFFGRWAESLSCGARDVRSPCVW